MSEITESNNILVAETVVQEQKPVIKMGWLRALLFLIVAVILMSIGNFIGLLLVAVISKISLMELLKDPANILNEMGVQFSLLLTGFGLAGTWFAVWIFRKFVDKRSVMSLGLSFKEYKFDLLQGMFWGLGMMSVGFCVLYLSGILTITEINFQFLSLVGYFALFFIAAINEEIMIRGYILNNLSQSVNKYLALLISSVLFSAMHLSNANMSLIPFINIVLAGILLGIYYVHKQNLWFPIGMHLTWNFFQGPVFGFEVSGNKTTTLIVQNIHGSEWLTGGEFGFEGSLLSTTVIIVAIVAIHLQFYETS